MCKVDSPSFRFLVNSVVDGVANRVCLSLSYLAALPVGVGESSQSVKRLHHLTPVNYSRGTEDSRTQESLLLYYRKLYHTGAATSFLEPSYCTQALNNSPIFTQELLHFRQPEITRGCFQKALIWSSDARKHRRRWATRQRCIYAIYSGGRCSKRKERRLSRR